MVDDHSSRGRAEGRKRANKMRRRDVLRNRVAIITGAANGIGEAIAVEFAAEGAAVVLADTDYPRAQKVAARIRASGGRAEPIDTDVASEDSVNRMVKAAVNALGKIDILVNNAGVYPRHIWSQMTVEQWDHTQAVNLKGCFLCSRAVFPFFNKRQAGKIINVASVTFWLGQPANLVHYIASKGGVIGFTRALAREVGTHNIQVNAITPGAVETKAEKKVAAAGAVETIVAQQCLKRRVTPRDIARTAVFLASADSDMITGQTINVDGGWAMH